MTIAECLQAIDREFNLDLDTISKVGIHLVQKVKFHYREYGTYPSGGWFLFYQASDCFLANGDALIKVELNPRPQWNPIHYVTNQDSQNSKGHQDSTVIKFCR